MTCNHGQYCAYAIHICIVTLSSGSFGADISHGRIFGIAYNEGRYGAKGEQNKNDDVRSDNDARLGGFGREFARLPSKLLWAIRIRDPGILAWTLLLLQPKLAMLSKQAGAKSSRPIGLSHALLHAEQVNVARYHTKRMSTLRVAIGVLPITRCASRARLFKQVAAAVTVQSLWRAHHCRALMDSPLVWQLLRRRGALCVQRWWRSRFMWRRLRFLHAMRLVISLLA